MNKAHFGPGNLGLGPGSALGRLGLSLAVLWV